MTKADELWEKHVRNIEHGVGWIGKKSFLAALQEYGEAVRGEAVKVCEALQDERHGNAWNLACEDSAAAIEKMKLP